MRKNLKKNILKNESSNVLFLELKIKNAFLGQFQSTHLAHPLVHLPRLLVELPLKQRGGDPGDDLGVAQQVRVGLGEAGGAGREAAAEVQGKGLPMRKKGTV